MARGQRRRRIAASYRWNTPDRNGVDEAGALDPSDVLAWYRADTLPASRVSSRLPPLPPRDGTEVWKQPLKEIEAAMRAAVRPWPADREIHYVIPVPNVLSTSVVPLDVGCRQRMKSGEWRQLVSFSLVEWEIDRLPDAVDRRLLSSLRARSYYPTGYAGFTRFEIPAPLLDVVLPAIVGTGRASLRMTAEPTGELTPVVWDDGPAWEFRLHVDRARGAAEYRVTGALWRGAERVELAAPLLVLAAGFVVFPDSVARLDAHAAFPWLLHLRQARVVRVPVPHGDDFLGELLRLPVLPSHELPPELAYQTVRTAPRPRLRAERGPEAWDGKLLRLALGFDYDGVVLDATDERPRVFQAADRRLIVRDVDAERAARLRLETLGVRVRGLPPPDDRDRGLALSLRAFPRVASALLADGWHVESDGRLYRQPGTLRLSVTTGIDWFELHGDVEFGDTVAHLPALLVALRKGESTVVLGDGTYGVLPEEWLTRYSPLARLGTAQSDHVRFARTQVGVLDALLAAEPAVSCDALFVRAREELQRFLGVAPADPPETFMGRLRAYQRDGVGWLHFLRQFGFGGCLADDMGLGKTVMVLALLEARRLEGRKKPSLVVVPRSLVFNWKAEAARFAPGLAVLDHTGVARRPKGDHFAEHDVVLTTYGTLRRDVLHFRDVEFDYVILDEAQSIKNADTAVAKAARLLRGDHRLALSGTPVENHLGELWSLFEFLNPGMLGAASAFPAVAAASRNPDDATRALLARALRPFVLRRTKAQVAPELPPRVEQTVYCELEPGQRALYDELRDHYRRSLLGRIDQDGLERSKIMVLEALLRLRQAACHPGLVDRQRAGEAAGKLDVLLPRLREVLEAGHKAIVFSQFTSFLAIVRSRLDGEGIVYEYLDGATRDRQACVTRFQDDPDCRLFLVSLKAGGLGLNLTAAEHVFILDPWWNPAVEAQAIDRAHRIGQTRQVLAFRLIARDTVEEKILDLQAEKRELADAIVNEQNSLIRTLTREDLELLLS